MSTPGISIAALVAAAIITVTNLAVISHGQISFPESTKPLTVSNIHMYVYNLFHVFDHEELEYVLGIGAFIQLYDAPNKKPLKLLQKHFSKTQKMKPKT